MQYIYFFFQTVLSLSNMHLRFTQVFLASVVIFKLLSLHFSPSYRHISLFTPWTIVGYLVFFPVFAYCK